MNQSKLGTQGLRRGDIEQLESRIAQSPNNSFHSLGSLRMSPAGVVSRRGRVRRHDNASHIRTLPYVPGQLRIDGEWPGAIRLKRGWARASVRPWNEVEFHAAIRLERGSHDFLRDASAHVAAAPERSIFSPALYNFATRIWRRAGYEPFVDLDVMERPVAANADRATRPTSFNHRPAFAELVAVDEKAFESFWRMSMSGLREALEATPKATVVEARDGGSLVGYAVVGAQMSTSFLQRIAVDPRAEGEGLGSALLNAALGWAARRGTRLMVLNVRPGNSRARLFYERHGFKETGSQLHVMRFDG